MGAGEYVMDRKQYRQMVQILTPLMHKSWSLGELDCVSLLRLVYEPMGFSFPETFEGWDWGSYAAHWKRRPNYRLMERFLMSLGKPIDKGLFVPGDLLIIGGTDNTVFPAIGLLNSKAITVDRQMGVMIFPVKVLREIKMVRRLV